MSMLNDFFKGIKIEWIPDMGYCIAPTTETNYFRYRVKSFLDQHRPSLNKAIAILAPMSNKNIIFNTTIVYMYKNARFPKGKNSLTTFVKGVWPHYSEKEIMHAIDRLISMDYIEIPLTSTSGRPKNPVCQSNFDSKVLAKMLELVNQGNFVGLQQGPGNNTVIVNINNTHVPCGTPNGSCRDLLKDIDSVVGCPPSASLKKNT